MQQQLYRLISGINRSVQMYSKQNSYYPPIININKDMSSKEMLNELDKLERYLRVPQLSYLTRKSRDPDSNYVEK